MVKMDARLNLASKNDFAISKTVKVTDFNPDKNNATIAIRKAINSGATKVIFDNPGFEYLTEPITLKSNQEIIFEDARALTKDCEDVSPVIESEFGKNVLISVKDKLTGKINRSMVNKFEQSEEGFMPRVFSKIEELLLHQNKSDIK